MQTIESIINEIDISFKWILLSFNFITILIVYLHKKQNKKTKQHHILFVTAHPDDQSMFFRPTITSLKEDYFVHLLCLWGKGTERQKQLRNACEAIGIWKWECIGDQNIVDGMKEKWCEETIRNYVLKYVVDNKIKAVFTFDEGGVSGHPNHKSIYYSLKTLQIKSQSVQTQNNKGKTNKDKQSQQTKTETNQQNQHKKQNQQIKIYYLESVCLLRKYSGLLEFLVALLKTFSWIDISPFKAYSAMSKHGSQFVWYRKLWVFLSRYSYINTFQRSMIRIEQKC